MKFTRLYGEAICFFAFFASCANWGLPERYVVALKPFRFDTRELTLPSGLRIVAQQDHSVPIIGVVTVVGAGSTSDPGTKEGIAHVVEHLAAHH